MHTDTGHIEGLTKEEAKEMFADPHNENSKRLYSLERKMVALSDKEAKDCESMGLRQRKGYMRNKLCVCGSGKKFKNCCWSKFS